MKSSLLPVADLTTESFDKDDYVVFGGTFDPFHEGHLGAVRRLQQLFSLVVLAPTTENPWKEDHPTPLPLRVSMIELVMAHHSDIHNGDIHTCPDVLGKGVFICHEGYLYSEELVHRFRAQRNGTLYFAVGEDIAHEVQNWKNWSTLGVSSIVVPIEPRIHAADIRSGQAEVLPSLRDFVEQHELYEQTLPAIPPPALED